MKVFLSYSRVDKDFVLQLAETLRGSGVDLWLDQTDIPTGKRWDMEIEKALENCQSILLVLSPDSVSSQNVLDEVSYALEESKHIIPVLYRETKIPFRLRRFQYTDFTGDFNAGISNLLHIFNVSAAKPQAAKPVQVSQPKAKKAAPVQTKTPPVKTRMKTEQIAQSLQQALTEGGNGNFISLQIDQRKNYYLQIAVGKGDKDAYIMVVSNAYLKPPHQLSAGQMETMKQLGFEDGVTDNFGGRFPIATAEQIDQMLATIATVVQEVFGVSNENDIFIEVNLESLS